MLGQQIKARLKRIPGLAAILPFYQWFRSPRAVPTLRLVRHQGLTVRAGPFRGLRYSPSLVPRVRPLAARLVGSYEVELHDAIEELVARRPPLVVNIGAAEGYYSVGMAIRCDGARVVAYEIDPFAVRSCALLAEVNGVSDRVEVRGLCTPAALAQLDAPPGTCVICDCEGGEQSLIDPDRVPWLSHAALVVEMHEREAPGIEDLLRKRLASSHRLDRIGTAPRYPIDFPPLQSTPGITGMQKVLLLTELRPYPMGWLVAIPVS